MMMLLLAEDEKLTKLCDELTCSYYVSDTNIIRAECGLEPVTEKKEETASSEKMVDLQKRYLKIFLSKTDHSI